MAKVTICGGDLSSLFAAFYLAEKGVEVVLLRATGAAGQVVPNAMGDSLPHTALLRQFPFAPVPKRVRAAKRSFYINKAYGNLLPEQVVPGCSGYFGCSIEQLKKLQLQSSALVQQLIGQYPAADFGLEKKGVLLLYRTLKAAKAEAEASEKAQRHGVKSQVLSQREVRLLEPNLHHFVTGAVLYPGEAQCQPWKLSRFLTGKLQQAGVTVTENAHVLRVRLAGNKIEAISTTAGETETDFVVVGGGVVAAELLRQLNMPLTCHSNYTLTQVNEQAIQRPAFLVEEGLKVIPTGKHLTCSSLSNAGVSLQTTTERLFRALRHYYQPPVAALPVEPALANRFVPAFPAGLYGSGFRKCCENIFLAPHAVDSSLAPAAGMLLAEKIMRLAAHVPHNVLPGSRF